MPRPFPSRPNLEHFRKQAKQSLRDVRNGDGDAAVRSGRSHPRWSPGTDVQHGFSLHDAQLVVAREFGFFSWRRLVDAVEHSQEIGSSSRHVVVTGGAGFIGSHLAERLLAHGHRVTAFDNLSKGTEANVQHLLNNPDFELVVGDMQDAAAVDAIISEANVVFHLAASFGVADGDSDCLHSNVHGTEVVAESASRHGARLLFASTSAIYGNLQPGAILHENDKQLLGSSGVSGWDYALSKLACEELTFGYSRKHHLRSSSVRLFNVIDARQSDRQVVGAFLSLAQQGRSSTVHGDGAQSLCFTDVSDAVEGLVRRADCDDAIGEVVNIGSRNEFTVNRLAEHVKAVTSSDSIIESVAHDYDMVPSRVPCLSKVRQLIGYAAVHGVEDSIREIIDLDHSN
jgi:UDP-glucose 4-epimerase